MHEIGRLFSTTAVQPGHCVVFHVQARPFELLQLGAGSYLDKAASLHRTNSSLPWYAVLYRLYRYLHHWTQGPLIFQSVNHCSNTDPKGDDISEPAEASVCCTSLSLQWCYIGVERCLLVLSTSTTAPARGTTIFLIEDDVITRFSASTEPCLFSNWDNAHLASLKTASLC